jgi:dihydroneopterin aldolase
MTTPQTITLRPHPQTLDTVRLRDISLPLPAAPEAWHRTGKSQPCTATLTLSYSSIIAAAETDNVSLTLDYGKLFRRLDSDVRNMSTLSTSPEHPHKAMVSLDGTRASDLDDGSYAIGIDPRVTGAIVANAGLGMLEETAARVKTESVSDKYGECEVVLELGKALLRAEGGLRYRAVTVWGEREEKGGMVRCPVVLEEEFCIEGIRCHAVLGVNPHERVEKQAVIVGLAFKGQGLQEWGSKVVQSYQGVVRAVAEVGSLSFSFSPLRCGLEIRYTDCFWGEAS